MAEIIDIRRFEPSNSDSYMFDANVWIFILCPIGDYALRRQRVYSNFLERCVKKEIKILLSTITISELINKYLHFEFDNWKNQYKNDTLEYKKDFRRANEFFEAVDTLRMNVLRNLNNFTEKINDNFKNCDFNDLLKLLGKMDFNDLVLIDICKRENIIFITDDSDFREYPENVKIITANLPK